MAAGNRAGRKREGTSSPGVLLPAVLLFVLVVAVAPGLEEPGHAARLALLVGAGPWALLPLAPGRTRRERSRAVAAAGLLAALPFLALLAGVGRFLGTPEGPAVSWDALPLAVLLVAGWGGREMFRREQVAAARSLALAASAALLAASLAGLAQAWFGWEGLPAARPPAGPFGNRNVAAQALVPLLALLLPAERAVRSRAGRWLPPLAGFAGAAFLIATRSRGGWAAAAAATLVGVVAARRGRIGWGGTLLLPALLAGALAGALVPVRGPEPLPSVARAVRLAVSGEEGSLAVRRALRENTGAMVLAHPLLGVGPGRFRVAYADWHDARRPTPGYGPGKRPRHVHCDALEWAAELGLPAAAGLLALLGGGFLLAARSRSPGADREPEEVRAWRVAAAAGGTGLLVHSLVSFPFQSPASAFLGFLLAGSGWGLAARNAGPGASPAGRGAGRRVMAALLVVLGAGGAVTAAGFLAGQRALARSLAAWSRGNCATAAREARRVFHREPWNRRDLGMAAGVLFRCDRSPAALSRLERAFALDPGSLVLALDVGARRLKAGRPDAALAAYRRALAIRSDLDRAWLGVAMASLARGDADGAREACRRALAAPDGGARRAVEAFCRGNRLVE